MAPERKPHLGPSPAAVVQEEGHGQRLGPGVLRTDVSRGPVTLKDARNPAQPLPCPAQTLPPLAPSEAFRRARELGTGNHTPRPYLIPISLLKLM